MRETHQSCKVTIEGLLYGGEGSGRYRGKEIRVPFSVPGDRLIVRRFEEKKDLIRARIVRIVEPGFGRVDPSCPHFGKCGGCHWQHLRYPRQVKAKRKILEEAFHRHFPQTRDLAITMKSCPMPLAYQSRARLQLRGSGPRSSIGFLRHGSRAVEDVKHCPLMRPALDEAFGMLRQFKLKADNDPSRQEMEIACSEEDNSWATMRVGANTNEGISVLIGAGENEEVTLFREIGGFRYATSASLPFPANDFMVPELIALVRDAAKGVGHSSVLNLFAGVGLFSLPLAGSFSEVVAVEGSPAACRLGSRNAAAAGFSNIQTVRADVGQWVSSAGPAYRTKFDLILLDLPDNGVGSEVMKQIGDWSPGAIICISGNPLTLIRDIRQIPARDYRIDRVSGLDLFPQTYRFGTLVRLIKRQSELSNQI